MIRFTQKHALDLAGKYVTYESERYLVTEVCIDTYGGNVAKATLAPEDPDSPSFEVTGTIKDGFMVFKNLQLTI